MRKRFKFVVRLSDDIPLWYEIQYCACYLLYWISIHWKEVGSGKWKPETTILIARVVYVALHGRAIKTQCCRVNEEHYTKTF